MTENAGQENDGRNIALTKWTYAFSSCAIWSLIFQSVIFYRPDGQTTCRLQRVIDECSTIMHDVDSNCGLESSCPDGHYAYYVSSGYGRNVSSKICFNGDE